MRYQLKPPTKQSPTSILLGLALLIILGFGFSFAKLSNNPQPSYAAAGCGATQTFKTVWKTNNPGTSNSTSITIPTTGAGYSYQVDWNNDGDFVDADEAGPFTGNKTHDFGVAGTYPIAICGSFPRIYFNNTGDREKILDITQWGDNNWSSMNGAFYGATNLTGTFSDTANVAAVTDISSAFRSATAFNGNISGWNTSNVINTGSTFTAASSFNRNISSWDMADVVTTQSMFQNATAFNQPLNTWNTSSVTNMTSMFSGATAFNQPIGSWNMAAVTAITNMFSVATAFNQPLNSWNVSSVTNISTMFDGATAFNQPLNSWNTSNITNMSGVFRSSAFNQDISAWDMNQVTDIRAMFEFNTAFNRNLSLWDTSAVTDIRRVFNGATAFNQSLAGFEMNNVTDATNMLDNSAISPANYDATLIAWDAQVLKPNVPLGAIGLTYCAADSNRTHMMTAVVSGGDAWLITGDSECSTNQFITTWRTTTASEAITIPTVGAGYNYTVDWGDGSPITAHSGTAPASNATHTYATAGTYDVKIDGAFPRFYINNGTDHASIANATLLANKNKLLDVKQWGNNKWTSLANSFWGATNLTGSFSDVPNLTQTSLNLASAFRGATNFNGNVSGWNTSTVVNINSLFFGATVFNQPLNSWNVSGVTTMADTFRDATAFNQPLNSWNTGSVTITSGLFFGATVFNQNINSWDMADVTTTHSMFRNATAFNQPIGSWNTGSVTTMASMFQSATAFNQPIGSWNTANVTTLAATFFGATAFNQPIGSWNTGSALSMDSFFGNATAFDQDISAWDTSSVTNMRSMFINADSFNQPVNSWDVSSVTNMRDLFAGTASFNQPLNSWDVSAVTEMFEMFDSTVVFNQPLSNWNTSNVIVMQDMFENTPAFNQSLAGFEMNNVTDALDMLSSSGLSTANYDATLIAWDAQALKPNVPLGAIGLTYCVAESQRAHMMSSVGSGGDAWLITGDIKRCPPTDVLIDGNHFDAVAENQVANAVVGTLTTTDGDVGDSFSYSLACTTPGADDAHFNISADKLRASASLDYELPVDANTNNVYEVCVRTTDSTSQTFDQLLQILVTDNNAAPTNLQINGGTNANLPENNSTPISVGSLTNTDDGENNPASSTYSLACTSPGVDDSHFSITASDLTTNTSFDFESPADASTNNVYNICVRVTDNGGLSYDQPLTVTITDVDDTPPSTPGAPDLTSATDSGSSNSDNNTNDSTPDFSVNCSESDSTITLYSNNPSPGTVIGTHNCTATGPATITTSSLPDGTHSITYLEEDSNGNPSPVSPSLSVVINTSTPVGPTITGPTDGQALPDSSPTVVSGTGTPGQTITVTTQGGSSTCSAVVQGDGSWQCSLSPQLAVGDHTIEVITTDQFGNDSTPATRDFSIEADTDGDGEVNSTDSDDDGDNVADSTEDASINNGDGNGDGTKDSLQANVTSIPNTATTNPSDSLSLQTTGCDHVINFDQQAAPADPDNFQYPAGLSNFHLTCANPGDSAQVTIFYSRAFNPTQLTARKFNGNSYQTIAGASFANQTIGNQTVTTMSYSIKDGGSLDQDGDSNSQIIDPAGLALNPTPTQSLADTGSSQSLYLVVGGSLALLGVALLGAKRYLKAR